MVLLGKMRPLRTKNMEGLFTSRCLCKRNFYTAKHIRRLTERKRAPCVDVFPVHQEIISVHIEGISRENDVETPLANKRKPSWFYY